MFVNKILLVIIFASILLYSEETSWSNWTSCSESEGCNKKSELECNAEKGIQCDTRGSGYKLTISSGCDAYCNGHVNEHWKDTISQVRF